MFQLIFKVRTLTDKPAYCTKALKIKHNGLADNIYIDSEPVIVSSWIEPGIYVIY